MSLAEDIIAQAADHAIPLTTIMRKCLILAARLKNDDLKAWVVRELEGFPKGSHESLPPHRLFHITAKGFFVGGFGSTINDQPLPSGVLPPELRWWATTAYAMQGIAAYEALIAKDPTGAAQVYWPADLVAKYQSKFFEGYALNRAWQEIPIPALVEMLDTIRTKVLQLTLELESDVGNIDRVIEQGQIDEVAPAVQQVFQTVVYGGTAVVGGQAGHSINVVERQLIVQGDFGSLASQLRAGGIDDDQINELEAILQEEPKPDSPKAGLGSRVKAWVAKAADSAAREGGKAAIEVAKTTLTSAIASYYGLTA